MSSKKDYYIINKLIGEFINSISDNDYESLINGTATIKVKKKELSDNEKNIYSNILNQLINTDTEKMLQEIDNINELKNKADKINFCDFLNIPLLKKDTNEEIKIKIKSYIVDNKEDITYKINKKITMVNSLERIADTLANYMDEKEAKDFLVECGLLSNKANLLRLANMLDVFVIKDKSGEEIIDIIVSTVVGAKIRSYKIRNKEIIN